MPYKIAAQALIERCSKYVEPNGFGMYTFWISSEEEIPPGISASIRLAAMDLLNSRSDEPLLRSAVQALAVTGDIDDITFLKHLRERVLAGLKAEVDTAEKYLLQKNKSPEQLLEEVCNRETFDAFVVALAQERQRAEELERKNSGAYQIDGALNWKNGEVSSYLYGCLTGLEGEPFQPSWKKFAEFLYSGKIYE